MCCFVNDRNGEELISFDKKTFYGIGGCCCCSFFTLLTIILIAVSIRDVDYGYYGVAYNKLTCELNENVYENGKHLMRPETQLMTYNKLTIAFDFTGGNVLYCLTSDGIEISLDLQVQYLLEKEEILDIIMEFGEEEKLTDFVMAVAADSIRDISVEYTAQEFYEERGMIEQQMETHLTDSMIEANGHISVQLLQIRNVHLPNTLMNAIEDKQRASIDITNAGNERAGALIEANTALRTAEIQAETQITVAEAESAALIAEATESASAIQEALFKRWSVWSDIKNSSSMTATNFVNDYLKAVVIKEVNNPLLSIRRTELDGDALDALEEAVYPVTPETVAEGSS